jgi:hypothetical protein
MLGHNPQKTAQPRCTQGEQARHPMGVSILRAVAALIPHIVELHFSQPAFPYIPKFRRVHPQQYPPPPQQAGH